MRAGDWIFLIKNGAPGRAVVSTVMKFLVAYNAEILA
jgi:hypothetical protein